jgi:hypothetical protein
MAKHAWSILCQRAELHDENLSIIGVIDQLRVFLGSDESLPANISVDWALVSVWYRSDRALEEELEQRITVQNPIATYPPSEPQKLSLLGTHVSARSIARLQELSIDGAGLYDFIVEHRSSGDGPWFEAYRVPLSVEVLQK